MVCHCLLGSVSVVFKIYRAMALLKFSSRSSARHSEAQLRLAPNRPCMTLVLCVLPYHQSVIVDGLGEYMVQSSIVVHV